MARKRHTPGEILGKLRAIDAELAKGQTAQEACRRIGVTERTYYHWRREYGGLQLRQAMRRNKLALENVRLKRAVANQALDLALLMEAFASR